MYGHGEAGGADGAEDDAAGEEPVPGGGRAPGALGVGLGAARTRRTGRRGPRGRRRAGGAQRRGHRRDAAGSRDVQGERLQRKGDEGEGAVDRVIADTDVLCYLLLGAGAAAQVDALASRGALATTAVNVYELYRW